MKAGEIRANDAQTRILEKVETAALLEAIPSRRIAPGVAIVVKDLRAVAVYDNESTETAAAGRILVPDDIEASAAYIADPSTAPGRWHVVASEAILATTDAAIALQKRTVTIGHADLTDADTSQTIDIGAVLPANARILGRSIHTVTAFSGGSVSALAVDIGTSGDVDAIVDGADLFAAAVDGQAATLPDGIAPNKLFASAGAQLIATVVSTGDNLVNLTAGAMTIDVLFSVLA